MPLRSRTRRSEAQVVQPAPAVPLSLPPHPPPPATTATSGDRPASSGSSQYSDFQQHFGNDNDIMADRTVPGEDADRIASPQSLQSGVRTVTLPPLSSPSSAGQSVPVSTSPRTRFLTLSTTTGTSYSSSTSSTSPTTSPLSPTFRRTRPRMPYSPMQQFGPPESSSTPTPTIVHVNTSQENAHENANANAALPPGAAPPVSPTQSGASYTTAPTPPSPTTARVARAHRRTSSSHSATSATRVQVRNSTRYPRASFDLDPESDRERERQFYGVDENGDRETANTQLNPPRPSFFREAPPRASWSSQDSSVDPASSVNGGASDSESSRENANGNGKNDLPPGAAPPSNGIRGGAGSVPRNGPYAQPSAYPRRYVGTALSTVTSNSEASVAATPQQQEAQTDTVSEPPAVAEKQQQQPTANGATTPTPRAAATTARPPRERAPPSAFRSSTLASNTNGAQGLAQAADVPQRTASPTSGIAATAAAVAATAGSRRSSVDSLLQLQRGESGSFSRDRGAVDRDRDAQSSNGGHAYSYSGSGPGSASGHNNNSYQHQFYGNGGYQYPPAPSPPPGAQQPMPMPYAGQGQYPGGFVHGPGGAQQQYAAVPTGSPSQAQFAATNMSPTTPGTPTPRLHNSFMSNSAIARASAASSSAVDLAPFASRITGTAAAAPPSSFGGHSRRESYADGPQTPLMMAYYQHDAQWMPPQPPFAQQYPQSPGTPPHELHHSASTSVLPRVPSTLREPFLSPASRPSSSFWTPPTPTLYAKEGVLGSTGNFGSNIALALPRKEPLPSSALSRKISKSQKPWLHKKDKWERWSWWVTFLVMWLGVAAGAVVCFFGYMNVEKIENNLCMVLEDNFDSFDTNTWNREVSLGGFGNGEFQMTTSLDENLFIRNSQLYIMPTLTSDEIGTDAIFDGHTYNLTGCTENNASACSVTSRSSTNTVINPVKSARITTQKSASIAFGKVEVRAKLPKGDWLWPAIWMLPTDNVYGEWPLSGEIDIMEARGNGPSYPAQGDNYVRSSLNWGPLAQIAARFFGWQSMKQKTYADDFHTYTMEWTGSFMRFSVDSRLKAMLDFRLKGKSMFEIGDFPSTVQNGSSQAVVTNPWENASNAAPFDQNFYLIIDLAVGGTSGWFPDGYGGKMWFDGSNTAMTDFAKEQSTWFATWPQSDDDRAFRIDSVKMWNAC